MNSLKPNPNARHGIPKKLIILFAAIGVLGILALGYQVLRSALPAGPKEQQATLKKIDFQLYAASAPLEGGQLIEEDAQDGSVVDGPSLHFTYRVSQDQKMQDLEVYEYSAKVDTLYKHDCEGENAGDCQLIGTTASGATVYGSYSDNSHGYSIVYAKIGGTQFIVNSTLGGFQKDDLLAFFNAMQPIYKFQVKLFSDK